jgi:zeaxanthin glucosyltransferase
LPHLRAMEADEESIMKIGFVSMPFVGHLNPMTTLARRLQSRGHEVAFIGVPDVEPFARAAGLDFVPFCENEYPAGSIAKLYRPASKQHGLDAARWSIRERSVDLFRAASKHLPQKLAETGVDALVIDVIHTFLELVPMSLGVPYVQVSTGLPLDFSGATPPFFFSWPNETTPQALTRNLEGIKAAGEVFAPVVPVAMSYADKMGLQIDWSDFTATTSKLAVMTQTPKEFDFPGIPWPAQFHYTGPFHDIEGREPIAFPWEKLTGNPLVYASMGTLVNGLERVYKTVLQAVKRLSDIQVVLSVGKNLKLDDLGAIPSNVIVVRKAPQLELLKRAALCITHAGLNTALESLVEGVPMVAIPIAYDQPGVAARVAYHGVGEFLEIEDLAVERVQLLIQEVLENPRYREKARWFQKVIGQTRGLDVAADVIERAFRLPVYPQPLPMNPSESMADRRVVAHT